MTRRLRLLLALAVPALLSGLATCVFTPNPDKDRFSCITAADCGPKYECRPQAVGNGLCYPVGQCTAEVCDGQDNDCNGVVDDGFDLQTDNANCGACGHACTGGTTCRTGACVESNCADGQDNDSDGLVDCADPDCANQPCAADAGYVCVFGSDAGADAGTADAGTDAGTPDGGSPGACVQRP